ncbi:hypothetical protein AD949_10710 [Acetobacter orleanensis]|nr:hypothetical protein AD949_10710 [Acetobacter orleanensis]PCD79984.1 hypothetical protein CO710_03760 [Acetobacter orleanensis]
MRFKKGSCLIFEHEPGWSFLSQEKITQQHCWLLRLNDVCTLRIHLRDRGGDVGRIEDGICNQANIVAQRVVALTAEIAGARALMAV